MSVFSCKYTEGSQKKMGREGGTGRGFTEVGR